MLLRQYHKRHERDLLDQKKEKEETLLMEMVRDQNKGQIQSGPGYREVLAVGSSRVFLCNPQELLERQQSEAKLSGEKHGEKKSKEQSSSPNTVFYSTETSASLLSQGFIT